MRLFDLHGTQVGQSRPFIAPYTSICPMAAGSGIIKGFYGLIIIEKHLSTGLIYCLVCTLAGTYIVVHLEISAVIHMGTILPVGISLDLAVGISPGTHCLGF